MTDLLLTIVCTTSIGVIIKLAETRTSERLTMLLFNYIVAMCVSVGLLLARVGSSVGTETVVSLSLTSVSMVLAPLAGFIFALNFFLMILAVKKRGVALPVSLMRLSAVVPVAASMIFFGEKPGWLQVAGMIGALVAAVMMSLSFRGGELKSGNARESQIVLAVTSIVLLFCFGLADLSMKMFERLGQASEKPLFLAVLFGCAGLSVLIVMIIRRVTVRATDVVWGIVLGVPNYFSSWFLVGALSELPSYIVFPTVTALTVMSIALIGRFGFGEGIGKWGIIGIVLTLASIVAVNL